MSSKLDIRERNLSTLAEMLVTSRSSGAGSTASEEKKMIATEPPVAARLPSLDRRGLIKGGMLGAGLAGMPLTAQVPGRGFTHGVASGEPAANGVLVWTRFVAGQDTPLTYELSDSADFGNIATGGTVTASADKKQALSVDIFQENQCHILSF